MTRILNYLQNKTKFADLCCVKPEIQAFHSHGIVKNVTNPPFLGAQYKKHDPIGKKLHDYPLFIKKWGFRGQSPWKLQVFTKTFLMQNTVYFCCILTHTS